MNIAQTILEQLGGRKFLVMTGAKDLVNTGNGLQMRLPRGTTNKATKFIVTLDADDTYTVSFGKIRKLEYKEISSFSGVYCDMLTDIFTSETGFFTSL